MYVARLCGHVTISLMCWALWTYVRLSDMLDYYAISWTERICYSDNVLGFIVGATYLYIQR